MMDVMIANRYQVLEAVGSGGIGTVWKAKDEVLQRIVAVKGVRHFEEVNISFETLKSHLMNEARMMARVLHPNIMPIYDLVQDGDAVFIVMPLLGNKFSFLETDVRERPIGESIRLLERIADGLDFLHKNQVIHRDLKPTNIFIGEDNQPYIADFGLPKSIDVSNLDEETASTLAYTAPEILSGENVTIYSDIFSFGILTFNMITGSHPFLSNPTDLVEQILHSPVPSVGIHRPELSEATIRDIDAVIARLTAKVPTERSDSAKAAIDDLYRIVYSGQQIIDGKLFISYARKDQDFVYALADELERNNVDFWVDRFIEYGSDWDQAIDQELADCDVMLVVVTPTSMQSPYVTYEWSYFMGARKPIFPFVPASAVDNVELHPRLQRLQFIKGTEDMVENVHQIIEVMSQAIAQRKKK
jgi:serine/threonine protein kinase